MLDEGFNAAEARRRLHSMAICERLHKAQIGEGICTMKYSSECGRSVAYISCPIYNGVCD